MAEGWSVTRAAKAAGVNRTQAYAHRERHPDFAAAWDAAYEQGTDVIEDAIAKRATEGYERPIMYKGEQVSSERVFSDRLAEITVKARRPAKWREQVALEVTSQPSADELAKAREEGMSEEVERASAVLARLPHRGRAA